MLVRTDTKIKLSFPCLSSMINSFSKLTKGICNPSLLRVILSQTEHLSDITVNTSRTGIEPLPSQWKDHLSLFCFRQALLAPAKPESFPCTP